MSAPEHDELRLLAIEIATDASQFVAHERSKADWSNTADTKSTPTDMVTAVDRASEARIVAALQARRPDDGLLGEEGTGVAGTSGLQWVIDPIDGTTNFVYGYPATAVSIAVVKEATGESVAGAVVDVGRGEVFSAAKGAGAFVDGMPIALHSGPASVRFALVSTGFSYSAETRVAQGELIARILPLIRDIRRGGSAALDLCWAAAGRVDAYFERGTAPWDRAAGMLVATEAGLRGGFDDPLAWVAHPRIADELLALIDPA